MAKQRKSHPGTIERRGNSFRIILYAGGERHTFTLPGVSKKDAEQFARTKSAELLEMADRQRLGLPGTESIDVLIQRFEAEKLPLVATNTRKSYAQSLKIFHRFLKAKRFGHRRSRIPPRPCEGISILGSHAPAQRTSSLLRPYARTSPGGSTQSFRLGRGAGAPRGQPGLEGEAAEVRRPGSGLAE